MGGEWFPTEKNDGRFCQPENSRQTGSDVRGCCQRRGSYTLTKRVKKGPPSPEEGGVVYIKPQNATEEQGFDGVSCEKGEYSYVKSPPWKIHYLSSLKRNGHFLQNGGRSKGGLGGCFNPTTGHEGKKKATYMGLG